MHYIKIETEMQVAILRKNKNILLFSRKSPQITSKSSLLFDRISSMNVDEKKT